MTAAVSTVANLSASHFGHIIACNGWRGEFRSLALAPPGYAEVSIGAVTVWVKLDQPCRIEARP